MSVSKDIGVVDLFCGVGGLTHGFYKEGFDVLAGIDLDASCKYPFEHNNESVFIHKSIGELTGKELKGIFGNKKVKILIGCAPCQPFSTYNRKKKKDDNWKLLNDFLRLVREVKPDIVSMENVPQIRHHKIFDIFVDSLKNDGYFVTYHIVYCPKYGIPQTRRRLVLFASKFGEISLIKETHGPKNYKTLRDTIEDLNLIEDGEVDDSDFLHRSSRLSHKNKIRIMNTPEGGSWKNWDGKLLLKCHRKKSGKSFGSVYGRMSWNEPSSTITTEFIGIGRGRFGHPVQDRAISIREAALIQTFPKSYRFVKSKSEVSIVRLSRHIGNAVPVRLGVVIARSIKNHLRYYNYGN